jgi:hypothetical protein
MNISEQKIFDSYTKNTWDHEVESAFYDIWNQPNYEFLEFVTSIINSNKNNHFTEEAIRLLGFYKDLIVKSDREIIKKLLHNVVSTSKYNDSSRQQAIMQLGVFGDWPDLTLRNILETDQPRDLKVLAFRAILEQLKLPHQVVDLEASLAVNGDIEPNFDRINQVTQARADGHFDHLDSGQ